MKPARHVHIVKNKSSHVIEIPMEDGIDRKALDELAHFWNPQDHIPKGVIWRFHLRLMQVKHLHLYMFHQTRKNDKAQGQTRLVMLHAPLHRWSFHIAMCTLKSETKPRPARPIL